MCQSQQSREDFTQSEYRGFTTRCKPLVSLKNREKIPVLFLFMFLYHYYFPSSTQSCLLSLLLIPRFCQFMHSCSLVTSLFLSDLSLSLCLVTLRLFTDSWYFPTASFASRFSGISCCYTNLHSIELSSAM